MTTLFRDHTLNKEDCTVYVMFPTIKIELGLQKDPAILGLSVPVAVCCSQRAVQVGHRFSLRK